MRWRTRVRSDTCRRARPRRSRSCRRLAALCLSLLDFETPLWLAAAAAQRVTEYLRFHCGCPLTAQPADAAFGLITRTLDLPDIAAFNAGDAEYPDRSATLLVQVASLSNASGVRLAGPGLRDTVHLDVAGIPGAYWHSLQASRAAFPCGVDIVFVWGERIAALPRTTAVTC